MDNLLDVVECERPYSICSSLMQLAHMPVMWVKRLKLHAFLRYQGVKQPKSNRSKELQQYLIKFFFNIGIMFSRLKNIICIH